MKRHQLVLAAGFFLAAITSSCSRKVVEQNNNRVSNRIVLDWNVAAFEAMGGPAYEHSLMASRINAMMQIAMHDAINAIEPAYEQYAFRESADDADIVTAAAYAGHTVLVASFPNKKGYLDSLLNASVANVPEGLRKTKGMEVGVKAGNAILADRAGDGADLDPIVKIETSAVPGIYNVVPPFDFVYAPHWKTMKLFGLERHDQFRPVPPPALTSEEYSDDFNEVKEVGSANSSARTADQTSYSRYWYETSEAGWNRVARLAATSRNLDIVETARMLALVNIALADAYTAGWDAKFHYNFWRPYTAIRAAGKDNNAQTAADENWEPLMPTPPVQDYPSTHSALGNAAAQVLIELLGNNTPFTMTSFTSETPGATRTFKSFSQAADENADSRVMAGIHFRFSCEAGQKLGNEIGKFVVEKHLRAR